MFPLLITILAHYYVNCDIFCIFLNFYILACIWCFNFILSQQNFSSHSYSVHNSFQNCSKYQHDLDTKLSYTIIIRCSNAKGDAISTHLKSSDNNITYNNFFIIMPSSLLITWHPPFYKAFYSVSIKFTKSPGKIIFTFPAW